MNLGTQLANSRGLTIGCAFSLPMFTAHSEAIMSQVTTAGRLLNDLQRESAELRQSVERAAGIAAEKADSAMHGGARLTLSEQLRLSEAVLLLAPSFSRQGLRLREQVLAARSYDAGDVERRIEAPSQRWERISGLR